MNDTLFFILCILLSFIVLVLILHLRKMAVMKRIREMTIEEKNDKLDHLGQTFGYAYDPYQDIFTTRLDALQKHFGYTQFYDLSAPYFNMIFDYETIYFDYNNRTWLIELWKGQYGINTGCEVGVYYADEIISPDKYDTTLFQVVDTKDMLPIAIKLNYRPFITGTPYQKIGELKERHWWVTLFKPGFFSPPEQLFVNISIHFKNYTMLQSFMESFQKTLPLSIYKTNGNAVYFTFSKSYRSYNPVRKIVRRIALTSCRIFCNWFHFLTKPYSGSGDKLLYLYYYLPFMVRFLLKQIPKR